MSRLLSVAYSYLSTRRIIVRELTTLPDYQGDLNKFYAHLTDIPNGTTPIDLSIDGGVLPPDFPHGKRWKVNTERAPMAR